MWKHKTQLVSVKVSVRDETFAEHVPSEYSSFLFWSTIPLSYLLSLFLLDEDISLKFLGGLRTEHLSELSGPKSTDLTLSGRMVLLRKGSSDPVSLRLGFRDYITTADFVVTSDNEDLDPSSRTSTTASQGMPTAFNLKLDVSDATTRDILRGPGSSSTEQIPSTSPILHSPFASSVDPYQHLDQGDAVTAIDPLRDEATALGSRRREVDELELHVVVVGGDVGAFVTALSLAKSEQIRVTLVNVGVGSLAAPGNDVPRGTLLNARTLSYLDELGRWRGPNYHSPQRGTPFDSESRLSRWKGKGPASDFLSIGERIQDEAICLKAYQLRGYSTGQVLTTQAYTVPTGEDVAMFGIDTNVLLTVLRDACLSHPRVELRPRGIVRSVLPGSPAPSYQDCSISKSTRNGEYKSQNTNIADAFAPPKQDRKRNRRVRESFIQLDDDEYDFLSPLSNASIPYSGTDASLSDLLRNLPSRSPERGPFSAEDLPIDIPSSAMKPSGEVEKASGSFKPAVVLTSGERIEADAVLGTEGPESKVLDAIRSGGNDGHSGKVVREDGAFKATVSTSRLLEDPDLRSLTGKLVTWLGPGRFMLAYPISYSTLCVSLTVSGAWRHGIPVIEEGEVIAHQMKNEVADWCPIVRKLVSLVDSATYEPVLDYNPLEKWVSNSGRVAIMGDAAHSLLPFTHQALNNIIFDALTLGALFRKLSMGPLNVRPGFDMQSPDLVPRLLHAFSALRRPQCIRIQLTLREGRNLFLLEDGEHQKIRDETLREGGLLSEDEKRAEWLYDPFEPVELWWAREAIDLMV
ncbi:hypothetical protein ACEPAF_5940 [Sanghuangporus sanghuang]